MLVDQARLQEGHRVLIWGGAGGLGVFAHQLCKLSGADAVGVVSSPEKGELVKSLGAVDYIDRNEFTGMMRRGDEDPDQEKARFKESRRFGKAVAEKLGGEPDIVFEHVGRATFPTSVLVVKPFGTVVICGATSGHTLDFDVRYLWMRQKKIIGSHFANAWECHRANELIDGGEGPSRTLEDAGLRSGRRGTPAHVREQAPRKDLDPRRRGIRGARTEQRTARARSGRRWGPRWHSE